MADSGAGRGSGKSAGTARRRFRRAVVRLPTSDLDGDLQYLTEVVGFRLDRIWPADAPRVAEVSGYGTAIALEWSEEASPGEIRLYAEQGSRAVESAERRTPGGHRIRIEPVNPPVVVPETEHRFLVTRRDLEERDRAVGRAGMEYRDLIPGRLGGAIIASHITIPGGGPVPDQVHFHAVRFQLIFCHEGWVRLVYEDQGPPFILHAGDCLIQPPEIRHRVLEASEWLEVVEVGVPAEHFTSMDHELALPTPHHRPEREFGGTRFLLDREADAVWKPWRLPGFEARDTGIGDATGGLAGVRLARREPGTAIPRARHDADILFCFIRQGNLELVVENDRHEILVARDAFVLPPGFPVEVADATDNLELLEVTLPAEFETTLG